MQDKLSETQFRKIVPQVILLWPDEINVEEKIFYDNGGVRFPNLVKIHDEIEKNILNIKSKKEMRHMHDVDWSLFTVIHEKAKNKDVVRIKNIDINEVLNAYLAYVN
jgi:hypothetical protein